MTTAATALLHPNHVGSSYTWPTPRSTGLPASGTADELGATGALSTALCGASRVCDRRSACRSIAPRPATKPPARARLKQVRTSASQAPSGPARPKSWPCSPPNALTRNQIAATMTRTNGIVAKARPRSPTREVHSRNTHTSATTPVPTQVTTVSVEPRADGPSNPLFVAKIATNPNQAMKKLTTAASSTAGIDVPRLTTTAPAHCGAQAPSIRWPCNASSVAPSLVDSP